jgi:hypothetical protein
MRRVLFATFLTLAIARPATAQVPSIIGGKLLPSGTSGHHFGMGIPSTFWEWWFGGDEMDYAFHVGLVYERWSGHDVSDVDVGLDLEAPMRFHVAQKGRADIAFKFTPGLLIGDQDRRLGRGFDDDALILGLRPEFGLLVGIELTDIVTLATGGVLPLTFLVLERPGDDETLGVVVPLMPRVGVEVKPLDSLVAWALLELGPTIGIADFDGDGDRDSDVDMGARFWAGVTWYP